VLGGDKDRAAAAHGFAGSAYQGLAVVVDNAGTGQFRRIDSKGSAAGTTEVFFRRRHEGEQPVRPAGCASSVASVEQYELAELLVQVLHVEAPDQAAAVADPASITAVQDQQMPDIFDRTHRQHE